jgi:cyclophilin family peptidyl-prolyl cis-trans isomerase
MFSPQQDGQEDDNLRNLPFRTTSSMPMLLNSESDESPDRMWPASPHSSSTGDFPPAWSANPQAPPSDENLSAMATRTIQPSIQSRKGSFMFACFIIVGMGAMFTSREAVSSAAEQVAILELNRQRIDEKLRKAEKDVHILKREISAMDIMLQQQQSSEVASNNMRVSSYRALHEMNSLQNRLKEESKLAQTLKTKVQTASLNDVMAKYGSGVHRVEIQLIFPDQQVGPDKFVIELAPTELVPHSIQTFLEMVSTGLLDGCSFILNALHVIKAAPLPYDGSSAAQKARAFAEHGLESVAFKEYSEAFPHKQFTVGFAADGSPSFYINTADNTEIHAGDPCFGKVVEGIDAIKRLEACPTRSGIWFEQRIGIKSAKIVKNTEPKGNVRIKSS